jgi:hypothetical protein
MNDDFPRHDTNASIDFLSSWQPNGPWVLSNLSPSGKLETDTFKNDERDRMRQWIDRHQGKRSMYFSVNPLRERTAARKTMKSNKREVAEFAALHIDIDPRAGEPIEEEQARALKLLNDFEPRPTAIIFSGNGYQGFWKLTEPCRIPVASEEDPEPWTPFEAYNRYLEEIFQADHCSNIDRVMRLPWTINVPSTQKIAKGRKPVLARLIEFDSSRTYDLDLFKKKSIAHSRNGSKVESGAEQTSIVLGLSVGTDELEKWAASKGIVIPPHTLAVMVNGDDPIDPKKYPSRSEALWAVCCGLARAGVSDDLIAAAVLDPNNKVSVSVREKSKPEKYAKEQVAKARGEIEREYREQAESADDQLAEMNKRHAVIVSGKVRVLSWRKTHPKIEREAPDVQSFEDFANRYKHKRVIAGFNENGRPVEKPMGRWWLEHPRRREIFGLCFEPGDGPDVDGFQNLWRGWGVDPKPGDWSLMREHIRTVLANEDVASDDYIVRWAAWAIQNPGKQAEAALVFKGGRGTGKGFFGRALKDVFGQHGLHIKSSKHLTGDFNLHLRDCCLLFADEALAPGDKGAEARLKGLITEPDLTIEGKGIDLVTEPNHLHVVMASNENWVVPAGNDERRFAVFNVSSARQQNELYFGALDSQLRGGGLAAMLYDLMAMQLGGWHPRHSIPQTDALRAQQVESLDGFEAFVFDMLSTDGFPMVTILSAGGEFVATGELREAAADWLKSHSGNRQLTNQKIAGLMKSLGAKRYRRGGGGYNGFLLPGLALMRANWDVLHFPWAWTQEETDVIEDKMPF